MNNTQYMIDRLTKQKDDIDNLLKQYQINTPSRDLIELRVLNENEEVDNLYVPNKTLFINDNMMVLKGVDGSLEKWNIRKVYPIDKKDLRISELESEINKLKEMINNEHSKSIESIRECDKSSTNDDGDVNRESETIS